MDREDLHTYGTPFKRHLSFFDRDNDGFIWFADSLRGNLGLGFDFPVAFVMAIGYQTLYGNTRSVFLGPLRGIEIAKVQQERSMLQGIDVTQIPGHGLDRKSLVESARPPSLIDKLHIVGIWSLAANKDGLISARDVQKAQYGTLLFDIERRRKDRSDILPLYRGGPISVTGHSWFVDKMFGVKVYQTDPPNKSNT